MTREPEVSDGLVTKAKAYTDTAIITICRFSGEGLGPQMPDQR